MANAKKRRGKAIITTEAGEKLPLNVGTEEVMETKLTRSEAIELMLQEAAEQVEARQKQIEKEMSDLEDLAPEELRELLDVGAITGGRIHHVHWRVESGHTQTSASIEVDYTKAPSSLLAKRDRKIELEQERGRLYDVARALQDKGKAKLQIMKQVLEGSEQGRAFLRQIEQMSLALNARLITNAAAPRPLPEVSVTTTVSVKASVKE
jgi:hypothetical protein